jgi:hypothetical protein
MKNVIISLAFIGIAVGLLGLVYAIREFVLYEHYVLPKRKRRATYIKPKR